MSNMDHNDEFIKRFREGEPKVIREVFMQYFRLLCYQAELVVNNQQQAEEIAVDSIVKLLNRRDEFNSLEHMKAFLFRVTRNAALNYLREKKPTLYSSEELESLEQRVMSEDNNAVVVSEVLYEIGKQVENLPDQCRNVFKLIFYDQLSTADIAAKLGISKQTVLNQKTRAIQLLRALLLKKDLFASTALIPILLLTV